MISVIHQGLYTSIQDLGRFGYRSYGVPVSGAMDAISAGFGNALLNNHKNDAVMEITMLGPKLEFTASTKIVLTGAEISPKLNQESIQNYKIYTVCAGDILSFGALIKGVRCYLAVVDGFQTPTVLKSKSFYGGITLKSILLKNDKVLFKPNNEKIIEQNGILNNKKQFYETSILEVYKGPEFELFSNEEKEKLISTKLTVSNHINRMGYRLEEVVVAHDKSIITSSVLPGTVQLVPSGQLIVLMNDAQTTGGYPRVFQLTGKSIAILAQKKAGDEINFVLVSI